MITMLKTCGRWKLYGDYLVTEIRPGVDYEILVSQIRSETDIEKWVAHIAEKSWATGWDILDLEAALRWILSQPKKELVNGLRNQHQNQGR